MTKPKICTTPLSQAGGADLRGPCAKDFRRVSMRSILGVVIISILAGLCFAGCEGARPQPIPFNHKVHVTKAELQCESCHENVAEGTVAGFPRVRICMRCHKNEEPANQAAVPFINEIRRHAQQGTEIPWRRLYALPPHVYFSHRRHTEIGGLECKECHGDMAELTAPPTEPVARTLTMTNCLDCHEARKVENDCNRCHR